ncbi:hypothetical protein GUITHDRAFT_106577 [Guillardia theta CCMP2712]|uniref:Kinesin-like protein n=1 Tax=Guillardia theta (strain CCMP2712) TaxID=905079 RepID=L1JGG6_GUITC|nr:hypothetical protein GUITHDRAFT_106577 [Guillardia theta CCMP2712]EKX47591.1 hypothetical protein GUITHDRAFT_106577 [Guillardia theta CCMP2712]|eukprot:XP_005834571.1 hypothetical protein GUITHDRAFT_106577 [Guillardia theta CCMP2712]
MGNEHSVIKNIDKRTARREHAAFFKLAIERFRQEGETSSGGVREEGAPTKRSIHVCVRKRPIFPHEINAGEYDVITCRKAGVFVHDARIHSDMRHLFINHHSFDFDAVFDESAENSQVYQGAAAEAIANTVHKSITTTILMYGQTGSGKTYTMTSIYEMAGRDLFDHMESSGKKFDVSVSFVELEGDICRDMLNRGAQTQLLTGKDGAVHPYPLTEVDVKSADELVSYIRFACSLRATEATGVHDKSSRSHACVRIFIRKVDEEVEGVLQLVDLAGSEHRIDSSEHDAARRKECAQINSSLSALKECIRAHAKGSSFIPFRKSKLTHLLKTCFMDGNATIIIATVSPSSKDTEHSLNTIRHACIMDGQGTGEDASSTSSHVTGGSLVREDIAELNITLLARQKRAERLASKSQPTNSTATNKKSSGTGHNDKAGHSDVTKRLLLVDVIADSERRALKTLDKNLIRMMEEARGVLGSNANQLRRLQSYRTQPEPADLEGPQDVPSSWMDQLDGEGVRAPSWPDKPEGLEPRRIVGHQEWPESGVGEGQRGGGGGGREEESAVGVKVQEEATSRSRADDKGEIERRMEELEDELRAPGISQAKAFAVKKKIAMLRAEQLRSQRAKKAKDVGGESSAQAPTEEDKSTSRCSPALLPCEDRRQRCCEGKNISPEVLYMLDEDAEGFKMVMRDRRRRAILQEELHGNERPR